MANFPNTKRGLVVNLLERDAQLLIDLAKEDGKTLSEFLASYARNLHRRRHRHSDEERPCRRKDCFVRGA